MSLSRSTTRTESVMYDSEWSGEDDQDEGYDSSQEAAPSSLQRRSSVYSTASNSDDPSPYLQSATTAMGTLQTLHSTPTNQWKRALKHKSGLEVFVSKEKKYAGPKGKEGGAVGYYAPVFKGEHTIKGFGPAAVFGVVGTRKLWDEWYKEGNLVENLSDTASLTYMCMKGIAGTTTRDLSLVEQVAGNATGTILFVSTSVTTPKVPRVAGRVRASIALNGWVLEPVEGGTRVTYYLHVNVKTFVPAFAAVKYLARRPICISKIDEYLQSHGPPPMAGVESISDQSPSPPSAQPQRRRSRRDSSASKRSTRSDMSTATNGTSSFAGLPLHVVPNLEADSYGELQKAQKLFKGLLASDTREWSLAIDAKGSKIWMRKREGGGSLPVVKGEYVIEGVTTEQVLGTVLSQTARKEWDPRFLSMDTISLDNSFDQGNFLEQHKGIYPTFGARHYVISRGVDRDDATTDHGEILVVSRSTRSSTSAAPHDSIKAQMDVSGWLIEPNTTHGAAGGDKSVKVTHIVQLDIKGLEVEAFINKILASELAKVPRAVGEFIDENGFAPFFLRWGEGPAEMEGEIKGDFKSGKVTFVIGGGGEGTMRDGKQKCWLQWSERMYERGVNVVVEPTEAATISKVEGLERTLEITWNSSIKAGATVSLSQAEIGDGAEDLYVDGKFLDRTVGMERGSGMKRKSAGNDKKEPISAPAFVATVRNGTNAGQLPDLNGTKKQTNGISTPVATATPISRSIAEPLSPAPLTPSREALQDTAVLRQIPEDAVLIINKDLYFTASQIKVVGGVIVAAWLWGKFS